MNHILVILSREQDGGTRHLRWALSTASQLKLLKMAAHAVMTRARVRLEGAHHLWRQVPSGELSIDPEADERRGWATGLVEAS